MKNVPLDAEMPEIHCEVKHRPAEYGSIIRNSQHTTITGEVIISCCSVAIRPSMMLSIMYGKVGLGISHNASPLPRRFCVSS